MAESPDDIREQIEQRQEQFNKGAVRLFSFENPSQQTPETRTEAAPVLNLQRATTVGSDQVNIPTTTEPVTEPPKEVKQEEQPSRVEEAQLESKPADSAGGRRIFSLGSRPLSPLHQHLSSEKPTPAPTTISPASTTFRPATVEETTTTVRPAPSIFHRPRPNVVTKLEPGKIILKPKLEYITY